MRTLRVLATGVQPGPFIPDAEGVWSVAAGGADTLDYTVDWTGWLAGDTLAASTWAVTGGALAATSFTDSAASARIGGLLASQAEAANTVTTANGRQRTAAFRIRAAERL